MTATREGWDWALEWLGAFGRIVHADQEPAVTALPVLMIGGEPSEEQQKQARELLAGYGVVIDFGDVTDFGLSDEGHYIVRVRPAVAEVPW